MCDDIDVEVYWEAIGWIYMIPDWPRNLNTIIDNIDDLFPPLPDLTLPTDEMDQVFEVDNSAFNSEWNQYILTRIDVEAEDATNNTPQLIPEKK
ncbi:hypothetical protein DMENIID0001_096420 [Sergentomyia squamirostris]